VFVGTDGGVFYTCNNGAKWLRLGTTLPNTVVTDVRYDSAFKRVIASTMGRGVWTIEEPTAASCDSDAGIGTGGAGGMGGASPDAGRAGAGGASGGMGGGGVDASGATGGGGSGQGGSNATGGGNGGAIGAGGGGGVSTGPTGTGPGTTTGGPGNGGSGDDSGCACSTAVRRNGGAMSLALFGIALAWRRRRRRDSQNVAPTKSATGVG
jgi:uncharacterized protein (TIGR03382 family)